MKFFDKIIGSVSRGVKVWGAEIKGETRNKTNTFVTPFTTQGRGHGFCILTDPRSDLADMTAILEKKGYSIRYLNIDTRDCQTRKDEK